MDVAQEPGVSKLPSSTIETLRASEMSTLGGENNAVIYCTSSSDDDMIISVWSKLLFQHGRLDSCYSTVE